jgi:hypothetical protein
MDALKKLFDDWEMECALHLMVEHGTPWEQATAIAGHARKVLEERIHRDPEYIVVLTEVRFGAPDWLN